MVYINEDPTNLVKEYLVSYLLKKKKKNSLLLSVGLPTLSFTPDLLLIVSICILYFRKLKMMKPNTTLGMSSIIHEGADATDPYEDVGIIVEGTQMLQKN